MGVFYLVEVMRRYSNRPDLLGPMLDVLRRIEDGDHTDELGEVVVGEIIGRFRAGTPKHKLAAEYGMSLSTMKRLLRRVNEKSLRRKAKRLPH